MEVSCGQMCSQLPGADFNTMVVFVVVFASQSSQQACRGKRPYDHYVNRDHHAHDVIHRILLQTWKVPVWDMQRYYSLVYHLVAKRPYLQSPYIVL